MISQVFISVGVMLAAAVASAVAIPLALRFGWRWQAVDRPNHRKHHEAPVPRTGGLAIAFGMLTGLLATALLQHDAVGEGEGGPWSPVAFIAATALVFLVGLVDDLRGCSVRVKLAVQIIAALMVVSTGTSVTSVLLPTGDLLQFEFAGYVLAVVWLVGITNAINFMDGLDGLAGGMSAIISASLAVFAGFFGVPLLMSVGAVICGACLGFLPFNWRPARIFLGDSGSLTIGFALASLSLAASIKSTAVIAILVPLLALGVPAIDALLVLLARLTEKVPGRSLQQRIARLTQADRMHVHHHGMDAFGHHQSVVLLVYAIVAFSCVFIMGAAVRSNPSLAVATVIVETVAIILIRYAGIRSRVPSKAGGRHGRDAPDPHDP